MDLDESNIRKGMRLAGLLLKLDSSGVKHEYRSEKKRSGRGIFRWPNGSFYEGDFVDNKRHGQGKQEWADGSYKGNFQHDMRDGYGRHMWCNGEIYEGAYLDDRRHGKGVYYWPNGTRYEGFFCHDLKDGFGIFIFSNGKRFEGFYKNNERNGPGILTYCDGRQDVGIWLGEKLIKLCSVMENAFMFQHFPDYYVNAGENLPVKVRRANSALAGARNVGGVGRKDTMVCEPNSVGSNEIPVPLQVPTTFPYADILHGVRNTMLGHRGPCEETSEELLRVAGEGDCFRVTELLEQGLVHVDVADKTGFTSLLAASVNCHKNVINCLLDYGADVNKLNIEGLSGLAACHVLFYTKHTWKDNIAETMCDENLFNSVQWDIPNGTFVQRRKIINGSHTTLQVPEIESDCSLKKIKEVSQTDVGNSNSHLKVDDGLTSSNILDSKSCSVNNNNCDENECANITELTGSCDKDNRENSRYKETLGEEKSSGNHKNESNGRDFENWSRKGGVEEAAKMNLSEKERRNPSKNEEERNLDGLPNCFGNTGLAGDNKRFIARHSSFVDKNLFIHEFLNRTASAMSNQNSAVSHDNMRTYVEDAYLNYRKPIDPQNENLDNLLEQNNFKNCEEKAGDCCLISRGLLPDSQQYSVQNTVGSSLQSSSDINGVDSLNSVEQNRQKLLTQQRRPHLEATVRLLLKRGGDPNASSLPMPVLFFAVKAADTAAVEILLNKGARTDARLSDEKLGITPLHIAVALPADADIITSLLLKAGADPDMRDFAFGKECGRTPLHTACCREDNDVEANSVISLLLHHKANPDLLCKGHSALSLAIASGNDIAVDTLLKHNSNPSLSLTHGVGSALCAAISFSAERRRKVVDRIRLVNKLIRNGANILAPIVVSNEHPPGTAVDYAYCVFYQDRRIAHTPYHALTSSEREVYVARRRMLDHLGELLRTHVLKKEKKLLEEQLTRLKQLKDEPTQDRTVSFYFDGSEKGLSDLGIDSSLGKESVVEENVLSILSPDIRLPDCGLRVAVVHTPLDHMSVSQLSQHSSKKLQLVKKNRFRYCYECGRSVSVRLSACTRCKEVFYCGRSCKLKAWNSRHKEECIRLSGTKKSGQSRRTDSPTPVTNPDKDKDKDKPTKSDGNVKERNRRNWSASSKEPSIKKPLSGRTSKSVISIDNIPCS